MKKNLLFITLLLGFGHAVYAQVLTVSATPVAGTCSSDAQINVTGSGGTAPYQFRLTAGPSGTTYPTPYQSGTNFSGLKAGAYTVQVMDNVGATATKNVTTTTSYITFTLTSATSTPSTCPVTPNGTVNINITGGKAPYSFSLLQGATTIYGPQASPAFTSVADGTYTAQVQDACGQIRTYSVTVALNDYKWTNVKTTDNNFISWVSSIINAATPFDTTKFSYSEDGPLLFTCDSITLRIWNTLTGNTSNVLRRVYIKDLTTGNIIWDNTFKPSSYPGNTSSSVHLKVNTNYRFYFDDLCNDIDSADRNFNYNNSDHYTINNTPTKTCSGLNMVLSHPSDWNTLNRYNSPIDTITVLSSSIAGDTVVGKQLIQNYANYALSNGSGAGLNGQRLMIQGVTQGAKYIVQIKTLCSVYNDTVTITSPVSFGVTTPVTDLACKLNTAGVVFVYSNLPATAGYVKYSITSGPASFTDTTGTIFPITYPIQDSAAVSSNGGQVNIYIDGFTQGTYTVNFYDQCGNMITKTITIGSADIAKISGTVTVNQQCPGASSITFNGIYQHVAGWLQFLKQTGGTYIGIPGAGSAINANTSAFAPSYTASGLADGNYEVLWLPVNSSAYKNVLPDCDTIFNQYVTVQYQLPVLDSAYGYVCTSGGSDGKVTLFGKNGVRPYQFQMIDGSGNALTAYQADSTFTGLSKGAYNFRLKDNCGNAVTYSYQLDTLKSAGITPSTLCPTPGNPLMLTADSIYSGSYTWKFKSTPTGIETVIANTRTLSINSLSSSDYGYYTVSYTIPGCSTSKSTTMTINNCLAVLPVTLMNFTAQLNDYCKVTLNWQTIYEKDINSYEVQQSPSADALSWVTIATLKQTGNNNNGINSYRFTIQEPVNGHIFYRLKIIDADGNIKYSDVLSLRGNCGEELVSVYPNPAIDKATVSLSGFKGPVNCFLYSSTGQLVLKSALINGTNMLDIKKLATGIYYLGIETNSGKQQFIKLRIGIK